MMSTTITGRFALPLGALSLLCAHCGAPTEPFVDGGADAARDGSRPSDGSADSGAELDAGAPDASAPEDVATAEASAPEAGPEAGPVGDACVARCEGRVCGDDGCGSVCGMCGGGATCTMAGQCSLTGMMGGGQWSLTAVEGDVSPTKTDGGSWDVGINMSQRLADAYVCVTIGSGREECSGFINNTIAPSWNYRFPSGVDTAQLTGGMLRVRMMDDDIDFDDTICAAAVARVTDAQVTARRFEFRCASGGVTFTLTAR